MEVQKATQPALFPVPDEADEPVVAPKKERKARPSNKGHQPPNLGKAVQVTVPDFADPGRPKTCLEVDFPIVPINALSALEGNAGKPIYQMSKWWARRRGCVFRAMLIAAAMQAPQRRKTPDGPLEPDESEAHKAVWDVYYANHQKAGNFKHLKVLDLFMGGGVTLVEGSRLGFQVTGVDLNPVAWFVVKNELACTDPDEVKKLFDQIEAEVKQQIQPYYVTECPRGHKGKWLDVRTGAEAEVDPITLPPEDRKHYRYEGPEVIYTFWAKHGPCTRPDCDHRTPVFRSPVIAEKELGVKYMELTCKSCKTVFHAELGSARMAPRAERVVLDNEFPFTELSQPFANLLHEYDKGRKADKDRRIVALTGMVETEPGLRCPKCGEFAGQWVRDVLKRHQSASRMKDIEKKHFKIEPPRNSTKSVYAYLLIHPDWLKGSPGKVDDKELGGHADATPEDNAAWYAARLKDLKLVEIRGRIKLAEDASAPPEQPGEIQVEEPVAPEANDEATEEGSEAQPEDRKQYGVPRYIRLADGTIMDTRRGTMPRKSTVSCGLCGQAADLLSSLKKAKLSASVAPYALQCHCPQCAGDGFIYGGRFFKSPQELDIRVLSKAEQEWRTAKDAELASLWPQEELPFTFMTHQNNGGIPNWGYTHFFKMFNHRQLLILCRLAKALCSVSVPLEVRDLALAAFQQYLRNQNMFCIWDISRDCMAPFFSNSNYAPKSLTVENCVFGELGRGNWTSCAEKTVEGASWATSPWEPYIDVDTEATAGSYKVQTGDPVAKNTSLHCGSATDLPNDWTEGFDLVITDPPFGDNIFYGDLANFFHVWLRPILGAENSDAFGHRFSPRAQECVADRSRFPTSERDEDEASYQTPANAYYQNCLRQCWAEAWRVTKAGGLLAFTFHHSADAPWVTVLHSLFDAGWILEAAFPIIGDETKGEGSKPGTFGSQKIAYDIIHVCRKRLEEPTRVSWPIMRKWVKSELHRLRHLLESYKSRELSVADIRVTLRGKALEFYSRHYGQVFTAENDPLELRVALAGINQLLDEDTGDPEERPPSIVQPVAYQFLRVFGSKDAIPRDEVGKSLRGTGITQKEFEVRSWTKEINKIVHRISVPECFEAARKRPRKEMKTEIDQAHFLIGAALPGSGVNLEEELDKDTWMIRRSVEAVIAWYAKTSADPAIRKAAERAKFLLARSIERRRTMIAPEQRTLFDDLEDDVP